MIKDESKSNMLENTGLHIKHIRYRARMILAHMLICFKMSLDSLLLSFSGRKKTSTMGDFNNNMFNRVLC